MSEDGLLPCQNKVATIRKAKVPTNTTELKSYLGLINYYNKFIPNLSARLYYLYNLLKNGVKFNWDTNCQKAFDESRNCLLETQFLEFYDPKKPIAVVSDASGYGLGGVIAHIVDGVEKPICFTSFSLNQAQRKYPILHLEALALVCTIKKFHKYLYGQSFMVYTDHKPLVGIFGKKGQHSIYVTRLQRYILELSIYDFNIQYRPSAKMGNADFCSRFPLEQSVPSEYDVEHVRSINFSSEFPIDCKIVARATQDDEFLLKVLSFMRNGWPEKLEKRFMDVFSNQFDLEMVDECLLYQDRVIIPQIMQAAVLKLLHANHAGMVRMKQLARRSVYWFGINKDIETFVKGCEECNSMAIVNKPLVKSHWVPTLRPFSRVHIDFFHFNHHTFLLIVDSFSKWVEIDWMKKGTDCNKVLKKLVAFFARFGLPDVLVSDGGPPFNSFTFMDFLRKQGINVLKSPPYNPSSNGQAERLVRTVKEVLKKFLLEPALLELDLEDQINLFLMNYRNNCLTTDGEFPSEKIFSFNPKTIIDLINPKKQYKNHLKPLPIDDVEGLNHSNPVSNANDQVHDPIDNLTAGDVVWCKNNNPHHHVRWTKGVFLKRFSKNIFQVETGSVRQMAHRNQLRLVTNGREIPEKPNLTLSLANRAERVRFSNDTEEPEGPPELQQATSTIRKRKRSDASLNSTPILRRSKRKRTAKVDVDFHYG